ncbi:hypothetical protein GUJ93_ZPchr0001g33007 [Zizania palustris]|uniref:NAB domain-containing protein n=1 Tax=Zizania palustris TaxID=103762 RepID=A0A8J5SHC2_ZIZPA|nr:hypothetical protein GUJ93_ZPchr0001g33007 [Zizania palustris]
MDPTAVYPSSRSKLGFKRRRWIERRRFVCSHSSLRGVSGARVKELPGVEASYHLNMTKKHKLGKSKHLLQNKKDVDDNVENILRMIGEENEPAENEPSDDSGNTFKKSKLSSLVKGFHEDYQYLHEHYKHLISKLENAGHRSSGSDSSDSDTEGERSDDEVHKAKVDAVGEENGWKQKLVEDRQDKEQNIEAEIEKLKQNTEEQAKEISDLKKLLDKAIKDKEATRVELSSDVASLSSENENIKLLAETAEREAGESHKTIALMENEIRTLSIEKQIIEKERDDMKSSIVDLENKREDLSNQLQDTVDKCTFLSSQLEKAQLAEKEVQSLLSEIEKMKNENFMLSRENDNLIAHEQNLDTECSQLKATIAETKAENGTLTEEKHLLHNKLQLLGVEIDGLTTEKEELLNNVIIERGAAAKEKERLELEHSKCLNELEKAQSSFKELESTNGALNDNIAAIQNENNSLALQLQQLEASFKNLGKQLEEEIERISVLQKNNDDLELANSNLQNELATVEGQKNEAVASTIVVGRKLEEQNQQISNLQETIENLEVAKTDMYNEATARQEEKNTAVLKVQQLEAYVMNLESELEKKQNQFSAFQQANEELLENNSNLERQLEEATSKLQEEITVLQGEKELALDNLQQSNTAIKTLEEELEKQREQNYILQLANEDLHKCTTNLEKQLEDTKVSFHMEILELQEQKNKAFSDLQQSEISIKNLRMELEQGRDQISVLHLANEDMKDNNYRLDQQLEETRTSLHAEIAALREEKDTAQLELQHSLESARNLEIVLEKQRENLSTLQQANDDLQNNNRTLTEQFEVIKIELQEEAKMAQEEKDRSLDNLQQSNTKISILEEELEKQKEQNSILQLANEGLQGSAANLEKQLEYTKVTSNAEILALQEQKNKALSDLQQSDISIKNLTMELEQARDQISILYLANEDMKENNYRLDQQLEETRTSLHAEIAVLREEKDTSQLELQHSLDSVRNLEIELEKQRENLSTLQQANDDLQKNNHTLSEELEVIKIELQEEAKMAQEEKERSLDNLQQSNIKIKSLEDELEKQIEQNSILQFAKEDLHKSTASLEKQLEDTKVSSNAEILALQEQNNKAFSDLQHSEISIKNLTMELEQGRDQISILHLANEDMKDNNYRLDQQLEETRTSLHAEIAALREEKDTSQLELQHSLDSARNLEIELEKQRENLSTLQQANDDLQKNNRTLSEELEVIKIELQEEAKMAQEEKERSLDNLQQSNTKIKSLEDELEKQIEQNSILRLSKEDLHKSTASLEKQLEDTKVTSNAEILALQEQKNKAFSDLQQSEISIKNLTMELEQGRDQISVLHLAIEDLKDNNYRLDQQLEEMRTSLHAEIAALREENDASQLELQHSLDSARNLETVLEKQRVNFSTLQQANDDLQKNNRTLTEQFEVIKIELQEEVTMAKEEKDTIVTQLEKSEDSIKNLESEMAQLKEELSFQMENNSILNKQLEEARLKVSYLNEELEKVQAEAASQINVLNSNTEDLVKKIDMLSSQKTKGEDNLIIISKACMEKISFIKDFEDQVKRKITDHETTLAFLQQSLRGIVSSCQRLQYVYGEVSTRATHLEVVRRNHIEQIDKLEDKNSEIMDKHRRSEEENLGANKENKRLQNHVQELEVQLQLAKQKLRVTEAESKCKEDNYVIAVETSQTEIQNLEQKIQKFSGRISSLEETLVQIKGNAESGVSTLADQLGELESHFNTSFSHFTTRTFACSEELKLLRNKLHDHLDEQKELIKENDKLGIRLRQKENVLSEMVRGASEAKEKMADLEKTIDEKEQEISARVQEKREAIKQLSDAIIYHKNNSDDLIRYIRNHNRRRLPFCL